MSGAADDDDESSISEFSVDSALEAIVNDTEQLVDDQFSDGERIACAFCFRRFGADIECSQTRSQMCKSCKNIGYQIRPVAFKDKTSKQNFSDRLKKRLSSRKRWLTAVADYERRGPRKGKVINKLKKKRNGKGQGKVVSRNRDYLRATKRVGIWWPVWLYKKHFNRRRRPPKAFEHVLDEKKGIVLPSSYGTPTDDCVALDKVTEHGTELSEKLFEETANSETAAKVYSEAKKAVAVVSKSRKVGKDEGAPCAYSVSRLALRSEEYDEESMFYGLLSGPNSFFGKGGIEDEEPEAEDGGEGEAATAAACDDSISIECAKDITPCKRKGSSASAASPKGDTQTPVKHRSVSRAEASMAQKIRKECVDAEKLLIETSKVLDKARLNDKWHQLNHAKLTKDVSKLEKRVECEYVQMQETPEGQQSLSEKIRSQYSHVDGLARLYEVIETMKTEGCSTWADGAPTLFQQFAALDAAGVVYAKHSMIEHFLNAYGMHLFEQDDDGVAHRSMLFLTHAAHDNWSLNVTALPPERVYTFLLTHSRHVLQVCLKQTSQPQYLKKWRDLTDAARKEFGSSDLVLAMEVARDVMEASTSSGVDLAAQVALARSTNFEYADCFKGKAGKGILAIAGKQSFADSRKADVFAIWRGVKLPKTQVAEDTNLRYTVLDNQSDWEIVAQELSKADTRAKMLKVPTYEASPERVAILTAMQDTARVIAMSLEKHHLYLLGEMVQQIKRTGFYAGDCLELAARATNFANWAANVPDVKKLGLSLFSKHVPDSVSAVTSQCNQHKLDGTILPAITQLLIAKEEFVYDKVDDIVRSFREHLTMLPAYVDRCEGFAEAIISMKSSILLKAKLVLDKSCLVSLFQFVEAVQKDPKIVPNIVEEEIEEISNTSFDMLAIKFLGVFAPLIGNSVPEPMLKMAVEIDDWENDIDQITSEIPVLLGCFAPRFYELIWSVQARKQDAEWLDDVKTLVGLHSKIEDLTKRVDDFQAVPSHHIAKTLAQSVTAAIDQEIECSAIEILQEHHAAVLDAKGKTDVEAVSDLLNAAAVTQEMLIQGNDFLLRAEGTALIASFDTAKASMKQIDALETTLGAHSPKSEKFKSFQSQVKDDFLTCKRGVYLLTMCQALHEADDSNRAQIKNSVRSLLETAKPVPNGALTFLSE